MQMRLIFQHFLTALAILTAVSFSSSAANNASDELKSFRVPAGFIVELVASEPDLPKPITVTWDDSGRMWTMTAVEYPVDGNESPAQAESLYKTPGRDRVLVFEPPLPRNSDDRVLGKPQIFADDLAIPLGLLPHRDGAFVHHGSEVVLLRDTDADGTADKREVILSGFGVQDSHLMPHQFTHAPGGWIYLAQGAFNYSQVRTRDGVTIRYDQTKLARFRPDGSAFEILTHGPCNIWGLVITRFGETWIQEANDYGYSMMRFQSGANYPGCGDTKFRPYAPMQPSVANFRMGGTGLSGLALCEDEDGFPAEWRDVMFVANPITRQVQAVRIHREVGGERLEKLENFMTSSDEMFRPIAIHFGPDACLYVVDWYNKIISHNEVPRNHPDRDKTRGRVWRVRHESQHLHAIPDVAKASDAALLTHLQSGNKWEWNAALNQIRDRKPAGIAERLRELALSTNAARQVRALWALEHVGAAEVRLLASLTQAASSHVRREAVRVAGTQLLPEEALKIAAPLAEDSDHYVRTEVIRVVSGQDAPWKHHIIFGAEKRPDRPLTTAAIETLVRVAKPSLPNANKPGAGYEREFERYLVRAALERHPAAVADFLDSPAAGGVPADNRRLACSVLDAPTAARHLGRIFAQNSFDPTDEEWLVLHRHRDTPEVAKAFAVFSQYPFHRVLAAALRRRDLIEAEKDRAWLAEAATVPLRSDYTERDAVEFHGNALEAVRVWKLAAAAEATALVLERTAMPDLRLKAVKALRELQSGPVDLLYTFATNSTHAPELRAEATAALAVHRGPEAQPRVLALWPALSEANRRHLVEQLSTTKAGGETLLAALRTGTVERNELPVSALEKMRATLAGHAEMEALWHDVAAQMKRVLRFNGGKDDYVSTKLTLAGPFTVEAWVRLDEGISNLDGILSGPGMKPDALDINFANAQFRVWLGSGEGDVVIAKRKTVASLWTHYAVTRDARGEFRIYINGELDAASTKRSTNTYAALDLARTIPAAGGTAGSLAEYRVWNVARTRQEILANFDRSFAGETIPTAMTAYFPTVEVTTNAPAAAALALVSPSRMRGNARVEGTLEPPPLLTSAEAKDLAAKFEKFTALAERDGDAQKGQQLFASACLVCHQAGGQGAALAPNLDGSALRGTEGLLRALLTPSAAMEAGYRKFRVETRDGEIHEGFLVQQDATGVTLRAPNAEPMKIPAAHVKRAGFQNQSIMPEGLLEAFDDQSVSDLFTYLRTLQ